MLASLLPVDPNFARLKPLGVEDKWGDRAEWDFFDKRRQLIGPDEPKRTYEQYFSTTLWPHSDIDLFVYGMTEAEAQKKLAILTKLRAARCCRPPARGTTCTPKINYSSCAYASSTRRTMVD